MKHPKNAGKSYEERQQEEKELLDKNKELLDLAFREANLKSLQSTIQTFDAIAANELEHAAKMQELIKAKKGQ